MVTREGASKKVSQRLGDLN